jgi:hypothetical protein
MDITTESDPAARAIETTTFPLTVRIAARVVSVVFHPLFIPVYVGYFLIYSTNAFPGFDERRKTFLLIQFLVSYTVLPLAAILLLKALGFVQTVYLKTQKDRIIPYIACGLFYFWIWYVLKNQLQPKEAVTFSLAVFLASSGGLLANSYMKISMHAISAGVLATYVMLLAFVLPVALGFYIALSLLIAGAVSTARLVNNDHHPIEVYAGLAIGLLAQLLAYYFVY